MTYEVKRPEKMVRAYLGVDVGSISTNLVVIDEQKNVLAKRYLMTEGRPLEAVKRGLDEIAMEVGDSVEILGVATTGSGRYLTADFIGADLVRNEITAQAEAAIAIDPEVDTIFEIGGQDSKYISIDNGVIVDFEMNKACAAGTGSFLEEQAERLGISIKDEFSALALSAKNPTKMGERCTVFIESDVMHHQQADSKTDDIVGGLCYSIVLNYLNKVVGDRRVGKRIFFQGGTAFNKGVVAAFEKVCGKPITVPSHHDVTGAIGVAILAMKEKTWEKSTFKGFDLSKRSYAIDTFECKGCENLCEIRRVTCEGETPLYYGSRCEKYDVVRRVKGLEAKDLFKVREELLHDTYGRKDNGGEVIGLPKILNMHELLPFWRSFLAELGFSVVLSDRDQQEDHQGGGRDHYRRVMLPHQARPRPHSQHREQGDTQDFHAQRDKHEKAVRKRAEQLRLPLRAIAPLYLQGFHRFRRIGREGGVPGGLFRQSQDGAGQPDGLREKPRKIEEGDRRCFRRCQRCPGPVLSGMSR